MNFPICRPQICCMKNKELHQPSKLLRDPSSDLRSCQKLSHGDVLPRRWPQELLFVPSLVELAVMTSMGPWSCLEPMGFHLQELQRLLIGCDLREVRMGSLAAMSTRCDLHELLGLLVASDLHEVRW